MPPELQTHQRPPRLYLYVWTHSTWFHWHFHFTLCRFSNCYLSKVLPGIDDVAEVWRQGSIVGSSCCLGVGVGLWEMVRQLSWPSEHLPIVIRTIHYLKLNTTHKTSLKPKNKEPKCRYSQVSPPSGRESNCKIIRQSYVINLKSLLGSSLIFTSSAMALTSASVCETPTRFLKARYSILWQAAHTCLYTW